MESSKAYARLLSISECPGMDKKADGARSSMKKSIRIRDGLKPSFSPKRGRYIGGTFGGSAYDNGNGTVTVRGAGGELSIPRNAWKKSKDFVSDRNMQFLPVGAAASGAVDAVGDIVGIVPQSFEPVVNMINKDWSWPYSHAFSELGNTMHDYADSIRAATDANPATVPGYPGTYGVKDPSLRDVAVTPGSIQKKLSYIPRAVMDWKMGLKPLWRTGKYLSTSSAVAPTFLRLAGGLGFARHGVDMTLDGHTLAGPAATALGMLGMYGPIGNRGLTSALQATTNKLVGPSVRFLSNNSARIPLVGSMLSKLLSGYMPAALAVSPNPDPDNR